MILCLNCSSETSRYVVEVLNPVKPDQREAFVEKLIDELSKRNSEFNYKKL